MRVGKTSTIHPLSELSRYTPGLWNCFNRCFDVKRDCGISVQNDLGIHVSDDLKWSNEISRVVDKANRRYFKQTQPPTHQEQDCQGTRAPAPFSGHQCGCARRKQEMETHWKNCRSVAISPIPNQNPEGSPSETDVSVTRCLSTPNADLVFDGGD